MQLIHSNEAIKPYFIPELGCEGLSTRDIAESTGEELKQLNRKILRPHFQERIKVCDYNVVPAGADENLIYLETRAAKALVGSLENKNGYLYLDFLLECERVLLEEVPYLIAERDTYKAKVIEIEQQIYRLTQKRIPGRRAGQIAVPVWGEDMFGNEHIVRYEMKTKEEVDEVTYLRGQLRHMQTVLVSLQNKTKDKTEEIMTKEMDRENKVLDLFSSKPT